VLPYRHPLVTAKAAATVDQVSGGRFIFGIGVGWDEEEFRSLGLPFAERGKMSDEYLGIIKAAWSSDRPSFEGHYLSVAGATFSPRPLQRPHPPIWAGGSPGTVSRASVRRVAESSAIWSVACRLAPLHLRTVALSLLRPPQPVNRFASAGRLLRVRAVSGREVVVRGVWNVLRLRSAE
jgi:alkanesulfonate monooxygenase SsuD/methylene tetrahydromethanopterin reductase-like flavin-dependent oxidoreductase (luciferase family)